jgi:hypothetical protein
LSEIPKLLTIADLTTRWQMSRQGIHDKKFEKDFPKPVQFVANGRTALYLESDVVKYEEKYPYVKSPGARQNRQRFIFALLTENE